MIKSARKKAAFEENWLEMKNEELSKQTFTWSASIRTVFIENLREQKLKRSSRLGPRRSMTNALYSFSCPYHLQQAHFHIQFYISWFCRKQVKLHWRIIGLIFNKNPWEGHNNPGSDWYIKPELWSLPVIDVSTACLMNHLKRRLVKQKAGTSVTS